MPEPQSPRPITRGSFQTHALTAAHWGVVGMAASMPVSRAVFNACALLMIMGWLLSGQWGQRLAMIRHHRVALASLGLFAVGACSLLWAHTPGADPWDQLQEYSRLLYVPLIVTLLQHQRVWWRRAWWAWLAGMLLTLAAYLLDIGLEVPGTRTYGTHTAGQGVFYHHIAQGMVLSFLGAYGLHRALRNEQTPRVRAFWLAVALATLAGLIAVGESRTGQLSVLAAYVLVVLTHLPPRARVWGVLTTVLVAGALVMGSQRVQDRLMLAFQEAATFTQDGERTSVGARLQAWQFSSQVIAQAPWLGHGLGAYRPLAHAHFAHSPICQLGVCEQPHNQFVLTAVETGALGLLALAAFLVAPLRGGEAQRGPMARLRWPFIAIVVVTACFDSSLQIQAQSFFVVTTLALLTSADPPPDSG